MVQQELASTADAPAQAHANGERLLVIEFQENHDDMAQLPALRKNIKKVGLTIDHYVKLKTTLAR